jgi:hypothetical protein
MIMSKVIATNTSTKEKPCKGFVLHSLAVCPRFVVRHLYNGVGAEDVN